ncbi:MAG: nitrilase-related carbon-nitrogen hydrolase, partial [Candidatus Bathyarchaeia archaeon]
MRIAMAQINATVGDIAGNVKKIRRYIKMAREARSDIVAFPELAITGYPPQDLLIQTDIVEKGAEALEGLYPDARDTVAAVGFVESKGGKLYNAAAILQDCCLKAVVRKVKLPTYDVFDEDRYFTPAEGVRPITLDIQGETVHVGFEICEDLWDNSGIDVTKELASKGAQLIIVINASPYHRGKTQERVELLRSRARTHRI